MSEGTFCRVEVHIIAVTFFGTPYQRVELNHIYTEYHCRILQQPAYKEVNIDKMLRDIPLFTVFPSRGLAREYPDVSREQNLVDSFWS